MALKTKLKRFNFGYGNTSGLLEILFTTIFLCSPNLAFIIFDLDVLSLAYAFIITLLLVSILVHKKYKIPESDNNQP